jgi:hypothetical protein
MASKKTFICCLCKWEAQFLASKQCPRSWGLWPSRYVFLAAQNSSVFSIFANTQDTGKMLAWAQEGTLQHGVTSTMSILSFKPGWYQFRELFSLFLWLYPMRSEDWKGAKKIETSHTARLWRWNGCPTISHVSRSCMPSFLWLPAEISLNVPCHKHSCKGVSGKLTDYLYIHAIREALLNSRSLLRSEFHHI